ncbi:MAG: hypothetical protein ACOYLH_04960 [Flavobacteriales bacterium]
MRQQAILIIGFTLSSFVACCQQLNSDQSRDITFTSSDLNFEKTTFNDQLPSQIDSLIQVYYQSYVSLGYVDCRLDTIVGKSGIDAKISPGARACIQVILPDSSKSLFTFKPWSEDELNAYAQQLLSPYEENGFPFARIDVVYSSKVQDSCYQFIWQVRPGPPIQVDSIVFRSQDPLPTKYLTNYLNFKKNAVYRESSIAMANDKLKQLPLLSIAQNPEIRFHDNKATVYFYANKKKSNYFNGIIGIRPDENTDRVFITGDVEIKLFNALNKAEKLDLIWKKLQPETQDLTAQLGLPFIFNLPIGLNGKINIYRRDSTFTSTKSKLGVVIPLGANDEIEGFFEKNTSSRLSDYTSNISGNSRQSYYGLRFNFERIDYTLNPRKGWKIESAIGIGDRTASANSDLQNQEKNVVWRPEIKVDLYIPTFSRQGVRVASTTSVLYGGDFYQNELFRIGGLRSIRGFLEESIFASSYSITSLEYRFLPELNTAFYIFSDLGWYEAQTNTYFVTDTPNSFGVGTNFATKAGIFTFNYAVGQQFNNPILFRDAKISFGFRNVF